MSNKLHKLGHMRPRLIMISLTQEVLTFVTTDPLPHTSKLDKLGIGALTLNRQQLDKSGHISLYLIMKS